MRRPAAVVVDSVSRHHVAPAGVVRAVDGISLEVAGGESVAIMGPSGCGKSTLLGQLGGLEPPTAGRVVVGGLELSALPERRRVDIRRRHLGFVFQSDNLLPFLTATECVAQQLALAGGLPAAEDPCVALLAELGLADAADKLPDQLSGGQRQRVAVARALIHRPAVILADEPTGSVDGASAEAVLDLLLAARATGATLVVVTHDPVVARRLDRTLELRDGRLVDGGRARDGQ